MIGASHKVKSNSCLGCGHHMDMAAQVAGDEKPRPGDVTLCIRCGHVMIFDADLSFRNMNEAEQREIEQDPQVQKVILAIKNVQQTATH